LWGGTSGVTFYMSVLKNRRHLSKLEFFNTAINLRRDITNLLLRDFGIKDESFPDWLIIHFRQNILLILRNLIHHITAANTIYPVNMAEIQARRLYQDKAVINCEQLLQEFQYCADIFPVKLAKFMPFVDSIELEIKLLKGWRKSTNQFEKRLSKISS
jgi:hypothetical protein